MIIRTKIEDMLELLSKKKYLTYEQIAKKLKWDEHSVEKIALILEKEGYVITFYPLNVLKKPWVKIKDYKKQEQRKSPRFEKVEEYDIKTKKGKGMGFIRIYRKEKEDRPIYFMYTPSVSEYTLSYIEKIKEEIPHELDINYKNSTVEEDDADELHEKEQVISKIVKKDLNPDEKDLMTLTQIILDKLYGLDEIETLIRDPNLEEVAVNAAEIPVSIYHRKYGWLKTNMKIDTEDKIQNLASQIARRVGRQINVLTPLLDAHLTTGDRVNATFRPVSSRGNTITLRLFARNPWTMVSLIKKEQHSMSVEMAALLWQAIHYEMNVLVAGGTASGKTSALNALLAFIPPYQRIITIEDTRELLPPKNQWNWVPLVTRAANPEGLGEVSMLDLVVNSLRMRPDRIIMGEIRRKKEAEVLFEAMHTGHSVYGTIHADTGSQVLKRLIEPPIDLPPSEVEDLNLVLVQHRNRRMNIRRTLEISEVIPGSEEPQLRRIYRWVPRNDSFQSVKSPSRYMEELNVRTGMTERESIADRKEKESILEWMAKKKIENVDQVGEVMDRYYSNPDIIVKAAKKNLELKKIL